ncbi:uncharacterized protein B0P05DRAFT_548257 [Gilbertella persicaria]|uniref:uncharacterized protein n=1 Tax=Gilbertella persicaria TaxID=101096 RepID=UPI00221F9A11|nr:uncharacterized protein B0P05DRAFT_548257 [Gilbertella persicaria]KAI8074362.1 hypothetical protein B0P05DRAFT_548257 [Gilbertella persicaria]
MFPSEKYFYIQSRKSGLVLSCDGQEETGSKLVIRPKAEDDESQLWKYEHGFLVCKKTLLVMDIAGGDLKVDSKVLQYNRKKTMTHNQRWGMRDHFIYAVADPRLVLNAKEEEGSNIVVSTRILEDNDHQQWDIEVYQEE